MGNVGFYKVEEVVDDFFLSNEINNNVSAAISGMSSGAMPLNAFTKSQQRKMPSTSAADAAYHFLNLGDRKGTKIFGGNAHSRFILFSVPA